MSGANIVGLRPDQQHEEQQDDRVIEVADSAAHDAGPGHDADAMAADAPPPGRGAAMLTGALALGWLGFAGWSAAPRLSAGGLTPADLAGLIALWSAPLALLGVLFLALLRTSRAESLRFADTARRMRAEAAALDYRVSELTARLEANREALAIQAEHMLRLGDDATGRLAALTAGMRGEAQEMARQAEGLKAAADAARSDLTALMHSLPRAQTQTRQLSAALQEAGVGALEQAGALEAQLSALLARGREADQVASGAAQRLATHLERMDAASKDAGERLDSAAGRMGGAVDAALARAADALDEARRSMETQGAAMLAMIEQARGALDRTGAETAQDLARRLAELAAGIDSLGTGLAAHDGTGRALVERLESGLAEIEARLGRIATDGTAQTERLAEALAGLSGHAETLATRLADADAAADSFVARAETLLTALDASAREIDETLPAALGRLDQYSSASRDRIAAMSPGIEAIEAGATQALDRLAQTEKLLEQQREAIELLGLSAERQLAASRKSAGELDETVGAARDRIADLADGAGQQLVGVMLRVRDAAAQAAERARETLDRVVPEAAAAMAEAGSDAVRQALGHRVEVQIAALAKAAEHAVEAANYASDRLSRQIAAVTDSTQLLEARLDKARDAAEDSHRESFARRASLLIEALNSTAIDVAKIMSSEVTDSAWAAYLKGDRGVFTRRAVRLLEAGETREILRHYEADGEFRDQVNRYIHDFEAMLRHVLATREGAQIGVTLLSADMGKLYVALAQAIERLRT